MNSKAYLQISFAWLFAIIVGAFILFLAIFFVVKLVDTEQTTISAKTGKNIGVLLNPLEIGFETAKTTSMSLPAETRILNKCDNSGAFGRQIIQVDQKSFGKWSETDVDISFSNKYIFSERYTEGKDFYFFSKPFEFPFKVADLIYMTSASDVYCFIDATEEIRDELTLLDQKNILVGNCNEEHIGVCFGGACDVKVNYNSKYVQKGKDKMYFESDALMYAAIFSDRDVYECQLKRLMQRISNLALLYNNKAGFISGKCDTNLDLQLLSSSAVSLGNSVGLNQIVGVIEDVREDNGNLGDCKLW
ncbi:MAG: hypothetical protein ABIA78_03790 [archaeon]